MSSLADGTYDVIVVDAQEAGDGLIAIECAVSSGPHRGEVARLLASNLGRSWVELLAMPATLTVAGGEPHLTLE